MPLSSLALDCVGVVLSLITVEDMKNMRVVCKRWNVVVSQDGVFWRRVALQAFPEQGDLADKTWKAHFTYNKQKALILKHELRKCERRRDISWDGASLKEVMEDDVAFGKEMVDMFFDGAEECVVRLRLELSKQKPDVSTLLNLTRDCRGRANSSGFCHAAHIACNMEASIKHLTEFAALVNVLVEEVRLLKMWWDDQIATGKFPEKVLYSFDLVDMFKSHKRRKNSLNWCHTTALPVS